MTAITQRHDFVLLFDVRDGNPNGDPDAGNLPRVDVETGEGMVTDVALKRKVRNFVGLVKGDVAPYEIYVKERAVLNQQHKRAYEAIGAAASLEGDSKKRRGSADNVARARRWMCEQFFDVRTFGAVMSTGINCGQVRGPVQMTFGRSVEPVVSLEHSITRMAVATDAEAEKQQGDNRTMGRKATVPYGLYRSHGFVSAFLAKDTGFTREDLDLFWSALAGMFDHDRSAARGEMATRGLYVFEHAGELGNAPAHDLFDRLTVTRSARDPGSARSFRDYVVAFDGETVPVGTQLGVGPNVRLLRLA